MDNSVQITLIICVTIIIICYLHGEYKTEPKIDKNVEIGKSPTYPRPPRNEGLHSHDNSHLESMRDTKCIEPTYEAPKHPYKDKE